MQSRVIERREVLSIGCKARSENRFHIRHDRTRPRDREHPPAAHILPNSQSATGDDFLDLVSRKVRGGGDALHVDRIGQDARRIAAQPGVRGRRTSTNQGESRKQALRWPTGHIGIVLYGPADRNCRF